MKKNKIILSIFSVIIVGILIPILFVHNINGLTKEELKITKDRVSSILDNPLDKLLILKIVISKKDKNEVIIDVYTFAGLKYASVKTDSLDYDSGSSVVRWPLFNK